MSMVLSSPPIEDGPLPSLKVEDPRWTMDGSSSANRWPLTIAHDFIESVRERFHESVRRSETLGDGPSSLARMESDWRFAAQGAVRTDSHGSAFDSRSTVRMIRARAAHVLRSCPPGPIFVTCDQVLQLAP
jgi:hypothetical protein